MSIGPVNGASGVDGVQATRHLGDIFGQVSSLAGSDSKAGGVFGKMSQGFSIFSSFLNMIPGVGTLLGGLLGTISKLFGGGRG